MTCHELVELVTEYLDGALSVSERERFEAHMALCEGCELYVDQIRTTVALVGESRALEERLDVAGLVEAFRGYRRRA